MPGSRPCNTTPDPCTWISHAPGESIVREFFCVPTATPETQIGFVVMVLLGRPIVACEVTSQPTAMWVATVEGCPGVIHLHGLPLMGWAREWRLRGSPTHAGAAPDRDLCYLGIEEVSRVELRGQLLDFDPGIGRAVRQGIPEACCKVNHLSLPSPVGGGTRLALGSSMSLDGLTCKV